MARFKIGIFITLLAMIVMGKTPVTKAPQFAGTTLNGDTVSLADFQGKTLLLDFWAGWCVPCRAEFPFLAELYKSHHKKGLWIVTVNVDKKLENAKAFLADVGIVPPFPVIWDKDSKIPPLYKLKAMPFTVLIDPEGNIRYTHKGFKPKDKNLITEKVDALLKTFPGTDDDKKL